MCLQGDLFKQNRESRPTTEEEIDLVERYFDVNNTGNSDYKWIGWVGLLAILVVAIDLIYTDLKILII